jgi:hypothetical protein
MLQLNVVAALQPEQVGCVVTVVTDQVFSTPHVLDGM